MYNPKPLGLMDERVYAALQVYEAGTSKLKRRLDALIHQKPAGNNLSVRL
jgi:hypothetical protein